LSCLIFLSALALVSITRVPLLQLEVLISELFTIDRFPSSSLQLFYHSARLECCQWLKYCLYITMGKVTTLGHELSNYSVELGPFVAKTLLMSAKGSEVLSSLGDYIVVEVEIHTPPLNV